MVQMAAEMEPENPNRWRELAELYQKRDAPDEAVSCRQRVVALSAIDDVNARVELGWSLQEDGRPDEAMEQYLMIKESRPGSPSVHFAPGRRVRGAGRHGRGRGPIARGDPSATSFSRRLRPPCYAAQGETARR